jgi:CHAT domain-containing protein/tetratricopeptide (TPR) repeat protein
LRMPMHNQILLVLFVLLLPVSAQTNDATRAKQLLARMDALASRGQKAAAVSSGAQALRALQAAYGDTDARVGMAANRVSACCMRFQDYRAARPFAELAMRAAQANRAGTPRDYLAALQQLGAIELALGDLVPARKHLEEAMSLARTARGYQPDAAPVALQLGALDQQEKRYGEAQHHFKLAIAILEQTQRRPDMQAAQALTSLGRLYMTIGDNARAEPYLTKGFDIANKYSGRNHSAVANALDLLGSLNSKTGDFARADRCFGDSMSLRERSTPGHPMIAATLHLMASHQARKGDAATAYQLQGRALAMLRRLPGASPLWLSTHLHNQAWYCLATKRYDEAEALLQEAEGAGPPSPNTITSVALLAALRGQNDEAISRMREVHASYDELLAHGATLDSEAARMALQKRIQGKTHFAIELAVDFASELPAATGLAYQTVLRRKGWAAETVALDRASQRGSKASTFAAIAELHRQISHRALLSERPSDREEARWIWEAERDLAGYAAELAGGSPSPATRGTVAAIASRLPADSVLIDYSVYTRAKDKLHLGAEADVPRFYAVFVLQPDGTLTARTLGPASNIEIEVRRLRQGLSSPGTTAYRSAASALSRLLLAPVSKQLQDTKELLISPDGLLHLLPFAVLPAEGQPLLATRRVTCLANARQLLRDTSGASTETPVLFAGPDYDARPDTPSAPRGRSGLTFSSLPGAMAEGKALKEILPEFRLLAGAEAQEEILKGLRRPAILHIATHGFFLNEGSLLPRNVRGLQRVRPKRPTTKPLPDFVLYDSPMLRSGIALAGANHFAFGAEDGILSALEASDLDLTGTQCVVLSACQTGLGETVDGAGVLGMRRAFASAGAQSLVVSLWKVHDDATRALMIAFYEQLAAGAGKSEALRQARLTISRTPDWQHPFYWAAFVYTGDNEPYAKP